MLVAPPMNISTQPTNQKQITALQEVMFTCEAKGFDVKYEWKHHKNSIILRRQSSLIISEAIPSDEDQYYCVAMTDGGYVFSNNVTLIVDGEKDHYLIISINFYLQIALLLVIILKVLL